MSQDKRGITLEVIDWNKDGTRRPFRSMNWKHEPIEYFWMHLYFGDGRATSEGGAHAAFMKADEVVKATSKMNVMIRGRDGKFISYRKLANTHHDVIHGEIDALPNI